MEAAIFSRERPTVGSIVRLTFTIFFANFLPLVVIGMVAYLPMAMIPLGAASAKGDVTTGLEIFGLAWLGFIVTLPAGYAGALYGVFQAAMGRPLDVRQCLAVGFRKLPRTLGVMFLTTLLAMLGFLLLIIPGIIVYLSLMVAVPVVAVEDVGVTGALKRSWNLMSGFRGVGFGTTFLIGLISACASFVTGLLIGMLGNGTVLAIVLNLIVYGLTGGLGIVAAGLIYFAVRSNKESIGVDAIAAAFD